MMNNPMILPTLALLIFSTLLSPQNVRAETKPAASDEKKISIPIQGDLVQRLEKEGLQPSHTQKVVPPEGFKIPEVPRSITNENLGPAGQIKMDQLERKQAEGKLTETESHLEKDTLFRDANLKF